MSYSPRVDDAVRNIRLAVASFESTVICTFRADLSRSIQTAITQTKIGHDSNHSTNRTFDDVLYFGIPWTELLLHWQRHRRHAATSTDSVAPLEEVITSLMNPCVVPQALSCATGMVFFRILIEDTTMAKSISANPLFHALRRLLETRPSARLVTKEWIEYIKSNLKLKVDAVSAYNVEEAHRLVSVCKHLASHLDGSAILKCLLTLLRDIDDVDAKLMQKRRRKKRIESSSCPCQQRSNRGRHWKRGLCAYGDLDGAMNDDVDESGISVATVELTGGRTIERVSRTAQPQHNPFAECEMCRLTKSSQGISELPVQLILLRSRVYKKIVSIFDVATATNAAFELRNDCLVSRSKSLLSALIFFACKMPGSASFRLCVVLLADSLSHRGYKTLVEYLWVLHQQRPTLADAALRIYSELVAGCSFFDEDSNRCWEALQPLLNQVASYCGTNMASPSPNQLDSELTLRIRSVLRCLSFILRHRRHTLVPFEASHEWQNFVSKLSLTFEDEEWWVSSDMNKEEREETLSTLQALGILSFIVDDSASDATAVLEKKGSPNIEAWPFPELQSIRGAHRRMGPSVGRDGLLSNPYKRLVIPPKQVLCRQSDKDAFAVPIMDYLNADSLRTIFSFLGYKRIARASVVCKVWKDLLDNEVIWRQAYLARFPISLRQGDNASPDSPVGSWKTLLANKVLAEKALRFKRHSSGWKHRTCKHIGCLMTLKSPNQMTTHYRTHERRKRKSTAKKASGSKRTKLLSRNN